MFHDVRENRNNQQSLLGGIQEMSEEVTINMPVVQVRRMRPLSLPFRRAQIDYQSVAPGCTLRRNTLLTTKQLAHRSPSLGGKGLGGLPPVGGHVCPFLYPRRLVVWVVTQPHPDRFRPFGCLFAGEAVGQPEISILHEMFDLFPGQVLVFAIHFDSDSDEAGGTPRVQFGMYMEPVHRTL